jgi:lipoprotein signal peptidase
VGWYAKAGNQVAQTIFALFDDAVSVGVTLFVGYVLFKKSIRTSIDDDKE